MILRVGYTDILYTKMYTAEDKIDNSDRRKTTIHTLILTDNL